MKHLSIALLLLCSITLCISAPVAVAQSQDELELKSIARSLLDGVVRGDTMAWERNLHRDFVLTDEAGNLVTRSAMLSYLRTLPPAENRIRLGTTFVRRIGKVAIVNHRDLQRAVDVDAEYQTTDTYVKIGGRWKLLASHVMALPRRTQ